MSNFKRYTVKAGENYTRDGFPWLLTGNEMTFILRFDESCLYTVPAPHNSSFSKAFGFKEGLWYDREKKQWVDRYSCRIGWRPVPSKGVFELAAYVHTYNEGTGSIINLGAQDPKVLYTAQPKEEVLCHLAIAGDRYLVDVEGHTESVHRGKGHWLRYVSRPAIGGQFTVNHDCNIDIKRL